MPTWTGGLPPAEDPDDRTPIDPAEVAEDERLSEDLARGGPGWGPLGRVLAAWRDDVRGGRHRRRSR